MKILLGSAFFGIVFCCLILPTEQQPIIYGAPIVANLHEETAVETEIVCINCTSPDGFDIEVSDITINPYAPFFDVYKLDPNPDFCVYYLPSQGSPDYATTRAYNIEIQCDDKQNNPVSENVEIRIRTNEPPIILSSLSETCTIDAAADTAGTNINELKPILFNDTDNDIVAATFTTVPASAAVNYELVQPDKAEKKFVIQAKNDLRYECNTDVSFYINLSDGKNDQVGPIVYTCDVINQYTAPTITNVDKEIYVSEDTALDTPLIAFETSPKDPAVTYELSTSPSTAISLFDTTNSFHELQLAGLLDYEDRTKRNINVSIKADNGYCQPEEHYLLIRVTDANDPPSLGPEEVTKIVYEGKITVNPQFTLEDNDTDDSWTYSIVGGNDKNYFTIDPYTGVVSSTVEYDTDLGNMPTNQTLTVMVTDKKGNANDTAVLKLVIEDANDNPPTFRVDGQLSETFYVSDCTNAGGLIGQRIVAEDKNDTSFEDNNVVKIVETYNQYLKVTPSGDVIQTKQIPAGTVSTLSVYAVDEGNYPSVKSSVTPVSITLVGTPCTTTQTVTVVNSNSGNSDSNTGNNAVTNTILTVATTTTTTAAPCTDFFCDAGNIAWTILGSLLGLLLLGLLGTLLYRYCCNKPVEVKRTWTPPKKVRPITPPTPPPRTPVTPKHIRIESPPRIQYVPTPVPVPVPPPQPQMVRVRRMVPVKQQQAMVKVKQMVAVQQQLQQNVAVKRLVPVPGNAAQAATSAAAAAPK